MPAINCGSCPKCAKRFSWTGEVTDRPPCPECGATLPRAVLEKDQKEVDAFATSLQIQQGLQFKRERFARMRNLANEAALRAEGLKLCKEGKHNWGPPTTELNPRGEPCRICTRCKRTDSKRIS